MTPQYPRWRVLWPLVPAMAMVMIDFTIVSISVTTIQRDLHLSATAAQWLVTAYALSTAAFIALGGRLGDIFGHKRIVATGIILFAVSSAVCGLTPDTSAAEPFMIVCRVLQGIGGAMLVPSATVLALNSFPAEERGKGLAVFFIVAGLFTAVGPIAGSYLTQYWTWRAIFWINVPVALLSLTEFAFIKLADVKHPARIDWRGAAILVAGMGLVVLGLQESSVWGWGNPATAGSIVVGLVLLAAFAAIERNTKDPTQAGFSILTMFYSFFIASRIGGGMMDKLGAKRPVTLGLGLLTVGLALWASELSNMTGGGTILGMLVTGAGFGFAMSALNTDALDRCPPEIRGQASGVIQTFRNFGSALGWRSSGRSC